MRKNPLSKMLAVTSPHMGSRVQAQDKAHVPEMDTPVGMPVLNQGFPVPAVVPIINAPDPSNGEPANGPQCSGNASVGRRHQTVDYVAPILKPPRSTASNHSVVPTEPLAKIFISRQFMGDTEFLCSFDDDTDFQMCRWVMSASLRQVANYGPHLQMFNERYNDYEYWTCGNFRNSPMSKLEVVAQRDGEFLFRVNVGDMNVFVWDGLNGSSWDELIHEFMEVRRPSRNEKLSDGAEFLRRSHSGFIFEGDRADVGAFVQDCEKNVVIVCDESQFENWCRILETKVCVVGYRGDAFSRGIARQFQIVGRNEVVLMTYPALKDDIVFLEEFGFGAVIFDGAEKVRRSDGSWGNAFRRMKGSIKGCLGSRITKDGLEVLKQIIGDKCETFFSFAGSPMKYFAVRPTTDQAASIKAATSDWRRLKCCQHPLTVQIPDGRPRHQLLSLLSSKFQFLLDFIRKHRNQRTISVVFRDKKLRSYFAELLDLEKIPYGDDACAELGLRLLLSYPGSHPDLVFSVDGDIPDSVRLVELGTIEHRIIIEENKSLAQPRVLTIVDDSMHDIGTLEDYAPAPGLEQCDEYMTQDEVRRIKKQAISGDFHGKLVIAFIIAMFRHIQPSLVLKYPLLIYQLALHVSNFDISIILCDRKEDWAAPVSSLFTEADGFRRFKSVFNNSENTLNKIEQVLIARAFGQRMLLDKLPPNYYYTSVMDGEIVATLNSGAIPVNCHDRVGEIIFAMKSELLTRGFTDRFCPQFWTKPEILQVLTVIGELGSQITGFTSTNFHAKTGLMSKTPESMQLFATDLIMRLTKRKQPTETVIVKSCAPPSVLRHGIPITISLTYDEYRPILQNLETNVLIGHAVDCMLSRNAPERCVGKGNWNYQMCSLLFQKIRVEYGLSYRNELLLLPECPFRIEHSKPVIDFLTKKFPVRMEITEEQLPNYFTNSVTFQNFVRSIINPSSSTITTSGKDPSKDQKNGRGYTLSPALLQRAAELHQQMNAEKKSRIAKMKASQLSPTIETRRLPQVAIDIQKAELDPKPKPAKPQYYLPNPEIVKRAAELEYHTKVQQQEARSTPKNLTPLKKRPTPSQDALHSESNHAPLAPNKWPATNTPHEDIRTPTQRYPTPQIEPDYGMPAELPLPPKKKPLR